MQNRSSKRPAVKAGIGAARPRLAKAFAAGIALSSVGAGYAADIDFQSHVVPILKSKCYECHTGKKRESDKKPKGGLALDTTAGILAGAVIEKGKPDESALYYRTILPADDEEIMPPKKSGPPLSKKETEILRVWIEEGARFGKGGAAPTGPVKRLTAQEVKAMGVREPDPDVVARLTEMGATITPFSVKTPQLVSVEFISTYIKIGDEQIRQLMAIAPNIVELNLAKTQITDEALKDVGAFARLQKLNLNNTKITDAGLAHLSTLTVLEWLNLYGTPVTDEGLPNIAKLRKLKSIYLWNSKISPDGVAKLEKALAGTKVVDKVRAKKDRFDLSDF